MKIKIENTAKLDMSEIYEYISLVLLDKVAAEKLLERMLAKIEGLREFPKMGQILETEGNLPSKYRMLHVKNYLIFYEIMGEVILVHRVVYARRDFLEVLGVLA